MLHSIKKKSDKIMNNYNAWCFIRASARFGLDNASHSHNFSFTKYFETISSALKPIRRSGNNFNDFNTASGNQLTLPYGKHIQHCFLI